MVRSLLVLMMVFGISASSGYALDLILRGTVVFRDTGQPIKGASVYLDGTSSYAVTDSSGRYTLNVPQRVNTSLIISHMDYNSLVLRDPFSAMPDTAFMKLRERKLGDVVVYPSPFGRLEMMRFFERNFLGITESGKLCVIENKGDIRFIYNPKKKTLMAVCDTPLIVNNRYLGYKLVFDMQYFIAHLQTETLYGKSYTVYFGTCSFQDNSDGEAGFGFRRDAAYDVSFRGLINSMVRGARIGRSDFYVFRNKEWMKDISQLPWTVSDTLSLKKLVINNAPVNKVLEGNVSATVFDEIKVQHKQENNPSVIYFLKNTYLVDPYGNIDNDLGVMFTGNMSGQRVGNMLPLDYIPRANKVVVEETPNKKERRNKK